MLDFFIGSWLIYCIFFGTFQILGVIWRNSDLFFNDRRQRLSNVNRLNDCHCDECDERPRFGIDN